MKWMKIKKSAVSIALTVALTTGLGLGTSTNAKALTAGSYTLNDLPIGTVFSDPNSTIGSTTGVKFIKVNQSPCIVMTYDDYFSIGKQSESRYTNDTYLDLDSQLYSSLSEQIKNNIITTTVKYGNAYLDWWGSDNDFYYYPHEKTWKLYMPSTQEILGRDFASPDYTDDGGSLLNHPYNSVGQWDYFKAYGDIINYQYPKSLSNPVLPFIFDKTPQPITFRDAYTLHNRTDYFWNFMRLYYNYWDCDCPYTNDDDTGTITYYHQEPLHTQTAWSMLNPIVIYGAGYQNDIVYVNYFAMQLNGSMSIYVDTDGSVSTKPYNQAPTVTGVTVPSGFAKSKRIVINATDDGKPNNGYMDYKITKSDGTLVMSWSTNNYCDITANGTYYAYAGDGALGSNGYTFTVNGIDTSPPIITSVSLSPTGWAKSKTITVTATDESNPVSLCLYTYDEMLINFDLSDWITGNTFKITENGAYQIAAKDALGWQNYSSMHIETQIDNLPPLPATITIN